MAYDDKYKTGLSWLNSDEDEPCAPKILKALYASIYDEHGDADVVTHLMTAYELQKANELEAAGDDRELQYLQGSEAEAFMRSAWEKSFKENLTRYEIPWDHEGVSKSEVFEWPATMPFSRQILKGVLTSVGKRMGAADATTYRALRDAYQKKAANG